jgi:hypothetical protein
VNGQGNAMFRPRSLESCLRSKDSRAVWRGAVGKGPQGTSLAAYPTARPVLNGEDEETGRKVLRLVLTQHQDDNVLDILVQSRRNKKAAKKFFRKLLKGLTSVPRVIITDKLKSYSAAKRELLPGVAHRQSHSLNNRCENSHRPTRQRERRMQGCTSPGHAQRFLAAYGPIAQPFRPRRHLWSASDYRPEMWKRFEGWAEITGTAWAA